jgi:alanine racemase
MKAVEQSTISRFPAWLEINITQLRRNLAIIREDMQRYNAQGHAPLRWCAVVKDNAYGHGAVAIARETLLAGASYLAVATLEEAIELQGAKIRAPILIFGERPKEEIEECGRRDFTFFVNDAAQAHRVNQLCRMLEKKATAHLEIDTGLSRYGVRWTQAWPAIEAVLSCDMIELEGVMTHFAMSDELDKSFANEQLRRFKEVIGELVNGKSAGKILHTCNTGGYLDLPHAHLDMVRIGMLPLGVYPSKVCRRLEGLAPIMSVKCKIAAIKNIEAGDTVGYGMRYRAESPRRIAVLPMGYGDGYPRVRNAGHVLIHGRRAPVIGGNAMDAMMVDITEIPQAQVWDEVVVMGMLAGAEISVHDLAALGGTVSYDVMTKLSLRLPRVYVEKEKSNNLAVGHLVFEPNADEPPS